ncbi:DUF6777 domain-containing protein [Streptomyces thioluteus]
MRSKPVPPEAARRRRNTVVWLTVPVLAAATGLTACTSSDSSGKGDENNGNRVVTLEGVGEPGDAPFLKAPDADVRGVSSAGGGGRTDATAAGAFGGTRQVTRCDKVQLLKELASDAEKAAAWAKARGISPQDIQGHVTGLTAVVLLHDTLVTNHNYVGGGRTRAYSSVLQAGMAVLVDAYGKPAVKCNCGNPLRQPDSEVNAEQVRYTGTRWEGFAAAVVTVVQPRPESQGPMKHIPLADVEDRGKAFEREVGDDGKRDSKPVPMPTPTAKPPTAGGTSPGGSAPGTTPPGSSSPGTPGTGTPGTGTPGTPTTPPRPTPTGPAPTDPTPTVPSSKSPSSKSPSSKAPSSGGGSPTVHSPRPTPSGAWPPSPTTGRHTPSGRTPTDNAPTAPLVPSHSPSSGGRSVRPETTRPDTTDPAPTRAPTHAPRPATTAPHVPTYQTPRTPSQQQPPHTPSEERQTHSERGERTGEHPSNPQRHQGT